MIHKCPSMVYLEDCTTGSRYPEKSGCFNIILKKTTSDCDNRGESPFE